MEEIINAAERLNQVIIQSRLNEITKLMNIDSSDRLKRIAAALLRLKPGAYLLGTGPGTVSIVPLTVEDVVLGRLETPGEEYSEILVDCHVNDTIFFSPLEVSRAHARIIRDSSGVNEEKVFRIIDLESTCGTYVNAERLPPGPPGYELHQLDLISLGISHTSTFVFYCK